MVQIRLRSKLLVLLFLSMVLVFGACSSNQDQSSEADKDKTSKKDELVLAIGGEPEDGFDPTTGWGEYGSPLFQSTLLKMDENMAFKKDLAKDYKKNVSEKKWTFKLRDDVKFSNGEKLTADDVRFTFETAKKSGSIVDLTNMKKVETDGDHSVIFTLKHPDSTFKNLLTSVGIVPKAEYDDTYNEHPVGSGPYEMVQWDKGQQLIVKANPYYYGTKPSFKKLTFLFLSEDATFAATKSHDVDVAAVTPEFANESIKGMHLKELNTADNRGIPLPYKKSGEKTDDGYPVGNDVTADKAVRRALNIAVDREQLVDSVLNGYGKPVYGMVDGLPWHNEDVKIKDAKMDKAKSILEDAGWKKGKNGIRHKDGLKAALTLYYPADDDVRQSLSIAFADMMKPLGIEIKTNGESWNKLVKVEHANPIMWGLGSHDPDEMYNMYSSKTIGSGEYNINQYENKDVDDYLDQALAAKDEQKANGYWKKAQWDGKTGLSVKGDAPWVWLVNLKHLYFVNDRLDIGKQKVQPHGHGWPVTDFIEKWHWKENKEG